MFDCQKGSLVVVSTQNAETRAPFPPARGSVSSPSGVRGGTPAAQSFSGILVLTKHVKQKTYTVFTEVDPKP